MANDGGPAFPMGAGVFAPNITNTATLKASGMNSAAIHVEGRYPHDGQTGMSLRDWFAGQALAGLMAFPHGDHSVHLKFEDWSTLAYKHADAMLSERNKP